MLRAAILAAFGLDSGRESHSPQAVLAQSSKQALEQLDAQLPGDLVNDPSRLDWESYGADLERQVYGRREHSRRRCRDTL